MDKRIEDDKESSNRKKRGKEMEVRMKREKRVWCKRRVMD